MNKAGIIKIAGVVILSFIVIVVVTFFLYPYLNEETYEEIQKERLLNSPDSTTDRSSVTAESNITGDGQFEYLQQELRRNKELEKTLEIRLDSMIAVNQKMKHERDSVFAELELLKDRLENNNQYSDTDRNQAAAGNQGAAAEMIAASNEPNEAFSERVKSLLNLDEEELEPIANQMSHLELVKIFRNSSNMQREKLLRSLTPKRAAKLMQEVML